MADYQIRLGTVVDTSNIQAQINRVKNPHVTVDARLNIGSIQRQINRDVSANPILINVRLNANNVQQQIDNIRRQLLDLNNITINLGAANRGTGARSSNAASGIRSTVAEANKAYTDLMNLAKRINSIRLQIGGLDSVKNSGQIQELSTQLNRLMTDYNNLYNTFTKGLNTSQLDVFENRIGSVEAKLVKLRATEQSMSKQGMDTSKVTADINTLEAELRELLATFASFSNGLLSMGQVDALSNVFQVTTDKASALNQKLSDTRANLAKGITANFGNYEVQLLSLENRFNVLSTKPPEVGRAIESVKQSLMSLRNADGTDELIARNEAYKESIKELEIWVRRLEAAEKGDYNREQLTTAKEAAIRRLKSLFSEGSAAAKKYGAEVKVLEAEINNCGNIKGVRNLNKQITALGTEIKNTRIQTKTFGESIKNQFRKYSTYFSVASVIMYSVRALRSMFTQVKAIDSAMTELKKVTNETNSSYNQFLRNAASKSKEIGTTIDGLVSSTSDFARLGYSFKESQALAEVANIYAVVGDEINGIEDATKSLVSTLAAFKGEMGDLDESEFAMSIVDKMNEVSNNFAISSGGIGEALQRSASSMVAANNSLDETIALITAANTVVQDPDAVGTAFKTLSMRIRGAKTEMEDAGLETDGMVESTSKLREEILALSGVDIMLNDNEFKSTYQILDELSRKWGELSDIQQATITELIAGKRQGNIVSSLMQNFDVARDALNTSLGSSGSAMEEHGKWSNQLEAHLKRLKAAWQSFAQTFLDSDFLKVGISLLTKFVDILDKILGNLGGFGTIGIGVAIASISNYFKGLKEGRKTIDDIIKSIEGLNASLAGSASATDMATEANMRNVASETAEAEANVASTTTEVAESEANVASATTEAAESAANAANIATEVAESEANVVSTATELAEAEANVAAVVSEVAESEANAAATATELAETEANIAAAASEAAESAANLGSAATEAGGAAASAGAAATKAAGGFAAFATSTAGVVTGIALLVAALGIAYKQYKKNKEAAAEARQEAISASEEYLNAASSFEQAYAKYSGKSDLTSEEEAELTSAIQGVTNALENKSNALQSIVDGSNDYISSLERIAQAEKEIANKKAIDKLEKASEGLYEVVNGWSKIDGGEVNVAFSTISIDDAASNEAYKIAKEVGEEYYSNIRINGRTGYKQDGFVLDTDASLDEIVNYYNMLNEYKDRLESSGLKDTSEYTNTSKAIETMSEAINVYIDGVYDAAKAQYQLENGIPKTVDEYLKMRESILSSDSIKNLSVETKKMIAGSLDSEYGKVFDLSDVQIQAKKFIGILSEYGSSEAAKMETFLNMRTAVNGNECTVGQYLSELNKISEMSSGWSEESKNELNLAFGIDADAIKSQYNDVYNYISRNYFEKITTSDMTLDEFMNYKTEIKELLNSLTATELAAVVNIKADIDWENSSTEEIRKQIEKEAELIKAMNFTIAINVEAEGIEALNKALSESKSATGLAAESIAALKERYKDLDGYNAAALFEETANGIRINSTELANLEKEYKDFNKQQADETLKVLKREYDELTNEINSCTDGQDNLNELYRKRDGILAQINNVAALAAQYAGLTSAYNEWLSAKEAGQDRDMYESIISGREEIEEEMSRGWLDDATVEYLELLSGKDLSTAGIDAQIAAYKELDKTIGGSKYSVWDFFTQDDDGNATSDGVYNFFDAIKSVTNETAAWVDENGKYHFDFEGFQHDGKTGDAAIASILGVSEELVQILLRAAEDAGFVVNIEGEYTDLANASDSIQELNRQLKEVGATKYTFNISASDLDYVNEQIIEAQSALKYFEDRDGKINLDDSDVRAAASILAMLIYRKSDLANPTLMSIDVSEPTSKLEEVIGLAQQLKDASANLEFQTSIGADTTEAQAEVDSLLKQISDDKYAEIVADLSIDTTSVDSAIASINAITKTTLEDAGLNLSVTYDKDSTEVDEYNPSDLTRTVTFKKDSYEVDSYNPSNITRTVTYKIKIKGGIGEINGSANINGTAFANGTVNNSGKAFKQGDWRTKKSETALVGELGREIVVTPDNKWHTVGDNGAEFTNIPRGSIVFNHKQTEELLANGKVTSGGGRGKALAGGTAYSFGGGGVDEKTTVIIKDGKDGSKSVVPSGGSSGTGGGIERVPSPKSNKNKKDKDKKDFEDLIDWIETAIARIERVIDRLDKKASSIYKSWAERNKALADQIEKIRDEVDLQQQAYNRYIQQADSVGLSEEYAEKVRNGTIDIEAITDEDLKKKIEEYQKWYEKALECQDAIEDLKEKEAELYVQRVENASAQYEGILGVIEHEKNMLDEYISQSEAQGHIVSEEYYNALMNNEQENLAELENQRAEMIKAFNEAMASGTIAEGSEAYYEMVASIDEVTLAIASSNTALLEYEKTLQQLNWEIFDIIQDKISSVADETEFLIELLSSDKLFDDKGQLTDSGMATIGQHGVAYNAYMHQADLAAAEIARLKAELEKDPYDTELEERYREMISLQQDYILSAQGEKEAIRDLVEEGINLELDALQELIDKKNEALESERDLYEYQKKVKEQTEEIAYLEKQMAAYSGDDSEEAKQKIQKIKVDLESARQNLEEAEYDKFINDSAAMLDELYLEYETTLNTRLDNIDALLEDMIEEINANAVDISDTLSEKAESVGYTLSDSMAEIWDKNSVSTQDVITTYSKEFINAQTTTNNALDSINIKLQDMLNKLNEKAADNAKSASTSSAATSTSTKSVTTTATTAKQSTSSGDGTPKIGDKVKFVDGQYYYDSYGVKPLGSQKQGQYVYITNINKKSGATHPYHISTGTKLGSGDLGWLKLSQISGYATGKKNFSNDEIAWTQEGATEFIVRPSDGAILTPIAKRDSVLTSAASRNIWDMANSPAEFIKNNLNLGSAGVPNSSNVQNNYTQHLEKVVISFPNVKNYDEVLSALRDDKSFEKLVHSMTIDRIAGKSSLAKGKSIR